MTRQCDNGVTGRCPFFLGEEANDKEVEMPANLNLKGELIRRYGSQIKASQALGIHESKLSYIVQGHREPTEREREALEKALGRSFVKRTL